MRAVHRMCDKMQSFIECSCLLSFTQVSLEPIQCGLQRSLRSAKITVRNPRLTGWAVNPPAAKTKRALRLKANCHSHLLHWGASYGLSEPLIMWKEKWLGEYMGMAYCNALSPVEKFMWTNIVLKTRVVRKRVPTSCCVTEKAHLLVWSLVSPFEKGIDIFGLIGRASDSSWVELQITHPITAQRNFSLLAELNQIDVS